MGDVSREMQFPRKKPKEMLEILKAIIKIKDAFDGLFGKLPPHQ